MMLSIIQLLKIRLRHKAHGKGNRRNKAHGKSNRRTKALAKGNRRNKAHGKGNRRNKAHAKSPKITLLTLVTRKWAAGWLH